MVEIEWQDPPNRSSKRSDKYADVIETLKANPGKWALVIKDMKTTAAPAAFRQAKCEATTRRNPDGKTWSVWARYPATAAPVVRRDAGVAKKAKVEEAITKGTALKPPPPPLPRNSEPAANDMGLQKFLADRRARGA